MTSPALLTCHNIVLKNWFHKSHRITGFCVPEGTVLLLSGNNNALKTRLLKVLAAQVPLTKGGIEWRGHTINAAADYHGEMVYLGKSDDVKPGKTVQENLDAFAAPYHNEMLVPAALQYFGLNAMADKKGGALPAGARQRVRLARLLLSTAKLWLLDEPAAGLDEEGLRLLGGLIASRTQKGGAVVMAMKNVPHGWLPEGVAVSVLDVGDFII